MDNEHPVEQQMDNLIALRDELSPNSQEETEDIAKIDEQREKLIKLPIGRVKCIAKMDSDVNLINQEATFLITKTTELFIDSITKEAYKFTIQSKKKTVQRRDVEQAIDSIDALAFLEGMLDQRT